MDQENKFYIVEFPDEVNKRGIVAMAIISSKWVLTENNELQCYWPTQFAKDSDIIKAVIEHEDVSLLPHVICRIKIKYKTRSYQKAKREIKNLEVYSNLSQSGSSESENERRLPKRKVLNDFIESFDSSSDNEPPKVDNETYFPRCTQTTQGQHIKNVSITELQQTMTTKAINQEIHQSPSSLSHSKDVSHEKRCACCMRNQEFYKIILKKLNSMETKLNQLWSNNKIGDADNFEVNINTMDNLFEVKDFDAKLQNTGYMASLANSISFVGGKDAAETTRRILTKLFTKKLSLEFNWSGRNNKEKFCDYKNILSLIYVAVRKNPNCSAALQNEIETTIKIWFRNACDREGGRQERRQ